MKNGFILNNLNCQNNKYKKRVPPINQNVKNKEDYKSLNHHNSYSQKEAKLFLEKIIILI